MIHIALEARGKQLTRLTISGHDPLGAQGSSVVCAAVSALTHALHVGLIQSLGSDARVEAKTGFTAFDLSDIHDKRVEAQTAMILATLQQVADQAPEQVSIERPASLMA